MMQALPSTAKAVTVRIVRAFLAAGARIEPATLYTCPAPFAAELVSGGKAVRVSDDEIAAAAKKPAAPPSTGKKE